MNKKAHRPQHNKPHTPSRVCSTLMEQGDKTPGSCAAPIWAVVGEMQNQEWPPRLALDTACTGSTLAMGAGASPCLRWSISPEPSGAEEAPINMTFDIATDEAIKAVITTVITIVVMKVGGWIAAHARRAATTLQNAENQKVPAPLSKQAGHFVVLFGLTWMLLKTIAYSGEPPSRVEVALIAGWTWATLTYILHMWRTSR